MKGFPNLNLTETWSAPSNERLVRIDGCNSFTQSRSTGSRGDGVAIIWLSK